jgi:hypothetical protein
VPRVAFAVEISTTPTKTTATKTFRTLLILFSLLKNIDSALFSKEKEENDDKKKERLKTSYDFYKPYLIALLLLLITLNLFSASYRS